MGLRFLQETGPGRTGDTTMTKMPWSPCLVREAAGDRGQGWAQPTCREGVRAVLAGRSQAHVQGCPRGPEAGQLRPLGAPWRPDRQFCRFRSIYVNNHLTGTFSFNSQNSSLRIIAMSLFSIFFKCLFRSFDGNAHRILEYDVKRAKYLCSPLFLFFCVDNFVVLLTEQNNHWFSFFDIWYDDICVWSDMGTADFKCHLNYDLMKVFNSQVHKVDFRPLLNWWGGIDYTAPGNSLLHWKQGCVLLLGRLKGDSTTYRGPKVFLRNRKPPWLKEILNILTEWCSS